MRPFGTRRRKSPWAAGLIFFAFCAMPIYAADRGDHDRARQALEAGEILSLKTVIERIESGAAGQVMDVDLERRHGRWVYEIKLLRPGGALVKLWVNASDGTILERHGRDTNPNR